MAGPTYGFSKTDPYFHNQIKTYIENLKDTVKNQKQALAKTVVRKVVELSPIRQGPYIKSHRVGINKLDTTFEPFETIIVKKFTPEMAKAGAENQLPPPMAEGAANTLRAQVAEKLSVKISKAKFKDAIYISNSIPYADQVEYIGWKRTGPYHVYAKAKIDLEVKAPLILNAAIRGKQYGQGAQSILQVTGFKR